MDDWLRRFQTTGRQLAEVLERAEARARQSLESIDVEQVRNRIGALESTLNHEIGMLAQRAKRTFDDLRNRL